MESVNKECEEYRAKSEGLANQLITMQLQVEQKEDAISERQREIEDKSQKLAEAEKAAQSLQEKMVKMLGIQEHEDIMNQEIEKIETDFEAQIERQVKEIKKLQSSKQ